MLNQDQFNNWCIKNGVVGRARSMVEEIRSSDPARRVKSSIKNVPGKYPSRKMGVSIQYESHTMELPFIYEAEHSPSVVEYYDQPNPVKLDYVSSHHNKQKRKTFYYTPDFFVMYENGAAWIECKPEEKLIELSIKDPERYFKDENGKWRCPPGETYAKAYNFSFYVFSSTQIDWVLLRNIKFLESYLLQKHEVKDERAGPIFSIVEQQQGILLQDLLERCDEQLGASADDIYTLMVTDNLYVDLNKFVLAESQYTHVYTDAEKAAAYIHVQEAESDCRANLGNQVIVEIGKSILWDGREWEIVNNGETMISLRSPKNAVDLPHAQFESYVKGGKITGLNRPESMQQMQEAILKASPSALKKANDRFRIIRPFLNGEPPESTDASPRTIRSWIEKYREALHAHGNGFIGLLPQDHKKGNHKKRLKKKTLDLIDTWVRDKYETYVRPKISNVYADFVLECQAAGLEECSYKTFVSAVHNRSLHEQTQKREGEKAAYRFESYYLEYEPTIIRHGDRPFEIGHIDHTEMDEEIIDSYTKKNLGKLWGTFLTDGCTRKILAVYVTFDPPSYRSCMMVLRECVRRYGRLPETVVVDGGKEFSSVYFETVLSAFGSGKKQRQAGRPRSGSVIERLFGTTNTRFIYNLTGNTQSTKNVRQLTKQNNPKKTAIWTYAKFSERLKQFAYEVYDQMGHPALGGLTPQEAFQLGLKRSGERPWMIIPFDETFRILTLPTSDKGTAKVEPGRGFKNNYIYYWNDAFKHPEVEGKQVPIRYDPYNLGIAYAYVNKRWVQCMSDCYAILNGKTEKQIQIATKELKRKHQNHSKQFKINLKILAEFLRDCESDELQLQQMKDQEVHKPFDVVQGKQTNVSNPVLSNLEVTLEVEVEDDFDPVERYGEF